MTSEQPPADTIVQVAPYIGPAGSAHRYVLTLSCGHTVLWDGQKPDLGKTLQCPELECHPITVILRDSDAL